jgi:hypothetical protein
MKANRIQLKLYAEPSTFGDPERFVRVFHVWIRDHVLDEVLIDVARYGHVHEGPAVMLVGHRSDYVIDLGEGRPGLQVTRKKAAASDDARLPDLFRATFDAARRLETDSELGGLRFKTNELLLTLVDRLNAPNDAATFAALESEIAGYVRSVLGQDAAISREGTPRDALAVRIRRANDEPVADIAHRLSER